MHLNAVQQMRILLDAADKFEIKLDSAQKKLKKVVMAESSTIEWNPPYSDRMSMKVAEAIESLAAGEWFTKVMEFKDQFWVLDSVDYFLRHAIRFAETDFKPTEEDIIMSRIQTPGIIETKIVASPVEFSYVVD